jgi:hypothetical protein
MIENPYYPRSASLPSFTTYPMSIMSTLVNSEQKPSSCRGQRHHGSCDHQIRETTSPQIILNEFGCCVKSFLSKNMTFPAWYFLRIPVISEVTSRKHGKEGDLCTAQIRKVYLPLESAHLRSGDRLFFGTGWSQLSIEVCILYLQSTISLTSHRQRRCDVSSTLSSFPSSR